ncbi:MAG: helix-turn-helix domain-containing protein [Chlorobi bacterium]|nr:helix-turn-helix domain-containing protein [Chlorobiota bacterium]MCI0715018.1 helix-turn-helix domain-containing protein [Chlorobiota bacterium]
MLKEFAKDLKKLRELKGITISEISAQTRINPKFLINIENGVFDFQPETYIRSFIKEYAKAIDENEHHVLNDYDKAKAGFYARRKFVTEEGKEIVVPEEKPPVSTIESTVEEAEEQVYSKGIKENKPDYFKPQYEYDNDVPNKRFAKKIILAILIAAVLAGIYFLVDYLNSSGNKRTEVKPKSFNEISSDYVTKIADKRDSLKKVDSLKHVTADSLRLMVKALKDITIKVYIDEDKVIEEEIPAKDSLLLKAKEQFRFSATANSSVELYLNGAYLRKPATLSGTSIKNLVIKKDGIVSQ